MDIFLVVLAFLCIILGVLGSFLPILPGPPISWVGLLLLYLTDAVPMNRSLIIVTFIVAILIFLLDYIIPAVGTKKFGGGYNAVFMSRHGPGRRILHLIWGGVFGWVVHRVL